MNNSMSLGSSVKARYVAKLEAGKIVKLLVVTCHAELKLAATKRVQP